MKLFGASVGCNLFFNNNKKVAPVPVDDRCNIPYLYNEHKEEENKESVAGYGKEEIFLPRLSRKVVFFAFCLIKRTHCDKPSASTV